MLAPLSFDARITATTLRGHASSSFWGHAFELGEQGLNATIVGELQVGEVVSLTIPLPSGKHLEVRASIRHKRGYHCGFEFLTMNDAQNKILKRTCRLRALGSDPV